MGFLVRRAASQPAIPLALLICIVIAGVALLGLLGLLAFYCLPRRSRDGQSRFREMYPRSSVPRSRQLHPPPPSPPPSPPPPSRMYPRIDREAPSVPFPNFPSSSFGSKPDLTAHPAPNAATLQNSSFSSPLSSSTSPLAKILQQTDPADVLAYAQQESVLTTDTQKQRELAEPRELVNPNFAPGRSAREWLEFSSTTSDDNTFGGGIDHAMSHRRVDATRSLRYPGVAMISEDGADDDLDDDDDDDDDSSVTDEDEGELGDEGEDEGQGSRTLQSANREEGHYSSHHRHDPAPNLQSLPPLSQKTKPRPKPPQSSKFSHQSALPQRLNLQKSA